jgi:hypothetical protein
VLLTPGSSRPGGLTPFFQGANHGGRADPEDSHNIADPAAVQRQVHNLSFHFRQAPFVLVRQQKDTPGAVRVLTPIALGAIRLFAVLHHRSALALGTLHGHDRHGISPAETVMDTANIVSQDQLN